MVESETGTVYGTGIGWRMLDEHDVVVVCEDAAIVRWWREGYGCESA